MVGNHNIHINNSSSNLTQQDRSTLSDFQNLSQGDLSPDGSMVSPNVNTRREVAPPAGMLLAEYQDTGNASEIPEFTEDLLKRES